MIDHPLANLLKKGTLASFDFAITEHGFTANGRDYRFLIQDTMCIEPGTYELTFTHVVHLMYETRIDETSWRSGWGDEFATTAAYKAAGEPDGYRFDIDWFLAYPGIETIVASPQAAEWSRRLQRPMYSASVETDRFWISMVFSGVHHRKTSDETGLMNQVVIRRP
ncbi:hypothetical protein [Acidipila sp. EB88]|uniref:YxiG-like protein n=1 Tax=Acidipila sp. EB88 TaxID=2305226 RepID=UPI000F5FBEAE|nr:hypothetical protein [Acidipila sp. EB88]RRA50350.1 hypothetical protein D1Y84_00905 [Acidipila sp. EB88]RRA50358.1 hypothetical protein D1Y84_00945 [Acidipila sp. EB88]